MASFSIDTFTSQLSQGGALASLFECSVTGWSGISDVDGSQNQWIFMCNGATLPPSTITPATVTYMGRALQIPGNRDAAQLVTNIYNDENMEIRATIENWMEKISGHRTNKRDSAFKTIAGTPGSSYTGTMTVSQLSKDTMKPTRTYQFNNVWPSGTSEVALSWETNEIERFDVTWEFSYWNVSSGATEIDGPS